MFIPTVIGSGLTRSTADSMATGTRSEGARSLPEIRACDLKRSRLRNLRDLVRVLELLPGGLRQDRLDPLDRLCERLELHHHDGGE